MTNKQNKTEKQKKVIAWVVVDPRDGSSYGAGSRDEARATKIKREKILRVEIVDGKPTAKFVR